MRMNVTGLLPWSKTGLNAFRNDILEQYRNGTQNLNMCDGWNKIRGLWLKTLIFLSLIMLSNLSYAESYLNSERLLIVRSADTSVYLSVETRFRAHISDSIEDLIHVTSVSLTDAAKLQHSFSPSSLKNIDFIITVGAKAAFEVLSRDPNIPVLSIFIPRQTYLAIRHEVDSQSSQFNRSAIYINQPDERLVLLAKSIAGERANVSLFATPNRAGLLKTAQCGSQNMSTLMDNVTLHQQPVSSAYLKQVLKQSDVVIATAKLLKESPSAIKWMLYMAYQRNLPVVAFSKSIVEAGALAAVYSTTADIGRHAAEVFLRYHKSTNKKLPDSMFPAYFHVSLNRSVAKALGYADLNEKKLQQALVEFSLNCQENYLPKPAEKVKQQMTQR